MLKHMEREVHAFYPCRTIAIFYVIALSLLFPCDWAFADYTDVETYSYEFLIETANTADVTPNEFVVNYIFSSNIVTGKNITDDVGVTLSNDVDTNLSHMRETEDYPKWENLPDEWKQRWGTPKDYYASKFNHLYAAGSGGRDYETDLSHFEGSGGNDFSWTDTVYDGISAIGRMFKKFLLGDANSVADILSNFQQNGKVNIENYMQVPNYAYLNGGNLVGWPTDVPSNIPVALTTLSWVYDQNYSRNYYMNTNNQTYRLLVYDVNNNQIGQFGFYNNSFKWDQSDQGTPTRLNSESYNKTINNITNTAYMARTSNSNDGSGPTSQPYITYSGSNLLNDMKTVGWLILYGGETVSMPSSVPIIDYPETLETNLNVYLPESVNPNVNWLQYITPGENSNPGSDLSSVIAILRSIDAKLGLIDSTSEDLTDLENALTQFNFTSGNLKTHDLIVYQILEDIYEKIAMPSPSTTQAIIGSFDWPEYKLQSENFEARLPNVAPFCALFLMKTLVDEIALQDPIDEAKFVIPFGFGISESQNIEIDLSFMDQIRPLINFLMIGLLLMSLGRATMHFMQMEIG